jgi:hypothetical protein
MPRATDRTSIEDVENQAEDALGRVKIMRVFDFVGMSEAVNELRAELEAPPPGDDHAAELQRTDMRREIPDSEDESDDDDMLFESEIVQHSKKTENEDEPLSNEGAERLGLILVDNITHVMNPILKSNYVQGRYHLNSKFLCC